MTQAVSVDKCLPFPKGTDRQEWKAKPMPNKCTRCGKIHSDDSPYLFQGCDKCGSKFFFYVREDALKQAEKELKELKPREIDEIEQDIRDIIPRDVDKDETVVLDLEAIRVIKPGKYRIDVSNLFTQRPIVIRVGPGRYELDLTTMMSKFRERVKAREKTS